MAQIEYDPNRSAYIALLHYADGEKRYILAPAAPARGNEAFSPAMRLRSVWATACRWRNVPPGTVVHNVELTPGRGGQMARSAGAGVQLLAKEGDYVTLRLPSGEMRMVRAECRATVGTIGNTDHQNVKIGKAGRKRHLGVRPQTRGTAMNPVDHPHGGGEGSTTPVVIRSPPGACPHWATAPARSARTPIVTSCAEEEEVRKAMSRSSKKGPFVDERLMTRSRP